MSRIACAWIPHFAAEVERQGAEERPLLVIEEGHVLTPSSQVAALGVKEGDPLPQALARCPDALVTQADRARYQEGWEIVLEILARHSPTVEGETRGIAYMDAAGMGPLYGDEHAWCQAVQDEIWRESRLKASIGVAGSKFAALVAAQLCGPNSCCQVVQGTDRAYLASFPVSALPLHEEVQRRLRLLGIYTMGQFGRLPSNAVAEQFGPESLELHRWVRGEDNRPLSGKQRRVLELHLDFDVPENRQDLLLESVFAMSQKALERLSRSGLSIRRIAVRLRLDSGQDVDRSAWLSELPGPQKLRLVLQGLLQDLQGEGFGVVEVELRLTGLEPAPGKQLNLFAHAESRIRLEDALRKLNQKYAPGCVVRARILSADALLVQDRYALEAALP